MASLRPTSRTGVFTLLLAYVVLISIVQAWAAQSGVLRLPGYWILGPLVASALLSFRQTLIVLLCTVGAIVVTSGFVVSNAAWRSGLVAIALVTLGSLLSLFVCRIRLDREDRIRSLMVARDRLTLLTVANSHVGSTLDVTRTAQELAESAVPRFADLAVVDLFDPVLQGEEPTDGPPRPGPVTLRRVARRSVRDHGPEAGREPGGLDTYPPRSVPSRCLASGEAARARILSESDAAGWLGPDSRATSGGGFHSGIAVPLRARGTTLGVAVFLRHQRPEPFDADDLLLAEEIGARAAVCVDNARRYTHEHRTSLTLQHSLLPGRLPELSAVEVATRYLPAGAHAGVGGDWFDVIPLSGARVALVVGDVVGHGLYASATMGRLRSAVRTLADIDLPPDELLTDLDDLVLRLRSDADPDTPVGGTGATCLYAVYDPVSRRCTLARAGHPLPALVAPDGRVNLVDLPTGPPLGLGGLPFESAELLLPEDSQLVLYTNGLIQSRRRDAEHGTAELLRALAQPAPSLEATCDALLKTLLDDRPTDDVALLVARTRALDAAHVATWDLPADPAAAGRARELAARQLGVWGLADAEFTTELVVSELVTNAIRHAGGPIQLRLIRERAALICEVSDGSSTSPHLRRARIYDEGGRGLFIVAQLTERWGTRHTFTGKTIWAELAPAGSPVGSMA